MSEMGVNIVYIHSYCYSHYCHYYFHDYYCSYYSRDVLHFIVWLTYLHTRMSSIPRYI